MFRVTAPMVFLKVPDVGGAMVSYTFYKDTVVPDSVDKESLQRHLDSGQVEEVGEKAADEKAAEHAKPKPATRSSK